MDQVDLLLFAEVADPFVYILPRILDAFRHAAETQVESVIGALAGLDELGETGVSADDPVNASVAGRQSGIARMAGHANLVLLGDGNDAFEEEGHTLPVLFG